MRHDRASLEREVATLRAAKAAEAAAGAELQKRCERLSAEKYDLEREKGALLAERAASSTKYQAASLAVLSVPGSPRGATRRSVAARVVDDMEARLATAGLPGSPRAAARSRRAAPARLTRTGGMQSPTGWPRRRHAAVRQSTRGALVSPRDVPRPQHPPRIGGSRAPAARIRATREWSSSGGRKRGQPARARLARASASGGENVGK